MKQKLERYIRHILAFFIHPGKEKTIKNVLKYALVLYLTKHYKGLCICITTALVCYNYNCNYIDAISDIIPQCNRNAAIKYFNGVDHLYWWKSDDWFSRYRFMKWLIKQY